jgi:hypothetical protein
MPRKLDWKLMREFRTGTDLDEFIVTYVRCGVDKSNKYNCTLVECDENESHKMTYKTYLCKNSGCFDQCIVRYLVKKCEYSKLYYFFQLNMHNSELDEFKKITKAKVHGLQTHVKEIIEEIMNVKGIKKPKKVFIKLHSDKYHSKLNCEVTQKQVNNYMYYRNRAITGSNTVEDVILYNKNFNWDQVDTDDDLFIFGAKYGAGEDNDHFQLGFTSIRLLERIFIGTIFHIDCTNKIIKYADQGICAHLGKVCLLEDIKIPGLQKKKNLKLDLEKDKPMMQIYLTVSKQKQKQWKLKK